MNFREKQGLFDGKSQMQSAAWAVGDVQSFPLGLVYRNLWVSFIREGGRDFRKDLS